MRHLSLFTGIGGFEYAAQTVWGDEWEPVLFCEIDKFCQKVLRKRWPEVNICEDIKRLDATGYGAIDLVTGGFPCQPYSVAGKRRGSEDDRALWPEMLRVISEAKPRWVLGENVTGILNMGFDDMLSDLEAEGYETETLIIPACAIGARHRRDRIWIVANSGSTGGIQFNDRKNHKNEKQYIQSRERWKAEQVGTEGLHTNATNSGSEGLSGVTCEGFGVIPKTNGTSSGCEFGRGSTETIGSPWSTEPAVGRVAHGIPRRVDRLKGLGNAIVPQVAMVIMQAIKDIDE